MEGGIFNGGYSTTALSSPCSSTHSETVAATQIENTFNEFVASNAVTASPIASMSPTANQQQSPKQHNMDIDCLSTERGSGYQENTEDESRDEQNMAERFVVIVDTRWSIYASWLVLQSQNSYFGQGLNDRLLFCSVYKGWFCNRLACV